MINKFFRFKVLKNKNGNPNLFEPIKAHDNDKCYDLRIAMVKEGKIESFTNNILSPKDSMIFHTGVSLEWFNKTLNINGVEHILQAEIKPRSGLGFKLDVVPFNGQIDNGYSKEILVKLTNNSNEAFSFQIGDRLCQIDFSFQPIDKDIRDTSIFVDSFEELNCGERGGFGSSGVQ